MPHGYCEDCKHRRGTSGFVNLGSFCTHPSHTTEERDAEERLTGKILCVFCSGLNGEGQCVEFSLKPEQHNAQ